MFLRLSFYPLPPCSAAPNSSKKSRATPPCRAGQGWRPGSCVTLLMMDRQLRSESPARCSRGSHDSELRLRRRGRQPLAIAGCSPVLSLAVKRCAIVCRFAECSLPLPRSASPSPPSTPWLICYSGRGTGLCRGSRTISKTFKPQIPSQNQQHSTSLRAKRCFGTPPSQTRFDRHL